MGADIGSHSQTSFNISDINFSKDDPLGLPIRNLRGQTKWGGRSMVSLASLGGVGNTLNNLSKSEKKISTTMEKLATGKNINRGSDGAALLGQIKALGSEIDGLEQANRNMTSAGSQLDITSGTQNQIVSSLQELRSLSVLAADESLSFSERQSVTQRAGDLVTDINRMAGGSEFSDENLLDISTIDAAIEDVLVEMGEVAALQNQFEFAQEANNSQIIAESEAKSEMEDLDYARATSDLNKQVVGQKAALLLLSKSLAREKDNSEMLSLKL